MIHPELYHPLMRSPVYLHELEKFSGCLSRVYRVWVCRLQQKEDDTLRHDTMPFDFVTTLLPHLNAESPQEWSTCAKTKGRNVRNEHGENDVYHRQNQNWFSIGDVYSYVRPTDTIQGWTHKSVFRWLNELNCCQWRKRKNHSPSLITLFQTFRPDCLPGGIRQIRPL